MSLPHTKQHSELDEQELCKVCGLCCDGTLFKNAKLDDDDLASLKKNLMRFDVDKAGLNFHLPCHYHIDGSCSVYSGWRPKICSRYLCKVIHRIRDNEISLSCAKETILNALSHAARVRKRLEAAAGICGKSLEYMFKEYVATHSAPDPSILLEYAALTRRIQRDFHKNTQSGSMPGKAAPLDTKQ